MHESPSTAMGPTPGATFGDVIGNKVEPTKK